LKPEEKMSQYLSEGWTNEPSSKNEMSVTIENLLSMNSGLNKKLQFQWEVNTHWHYSSAYDKIVNVLEWVYSKPWDEIYREELFERIGCVAVQRKRKFLHMDAREMVRFGLMVLTGGRWENYWDQNCQGTNRKQDHLTTEESASAPLTWPSKLNWTDFYAVP